MEANERRLEIEVESEQPGQAGSQAAELQDYIRDIDADLHVERVRTDSAAQDFGASLAVVLAAPGAIALARGISRWLERRNTSKVTLKSRDRSLTVENVSSRSAAELAQEIARLIDDGPAENKE
jgi:Effector Associated Constant Component 1